MRQVHVAASTVRTVQKGELGKGVTSIECAPKETDPKFSSKQGRDKNYEPKKSTTEHIVPNDQNRESAEQQSKGWQTIPKPKGHSALDYARWDSVDDDSSEDDNEDEDDESFPQYRFRVKTVGNGLDEIAQSCYQLEDPTNPREVLLPDDLTVDVDSLRICQVPTLRCLVSLHLL
ncbi:protein unc-45 A-like [Trifolium pratense]|uniref:Protein unc-45 A-like n=1 Tax=Trifolium pratense TaxID=57577 RepID=A0A2K3MKM9_TRIPR|nr:protein unc-45 A-like [Trifolium pratense]